MEKLQEIFNPKLWSPERTDPDFLHLIRIMWKRQENPDLLRYVEIMKACKKINNPKLLEDVRWEMSAMFALPETMWMEWLGDVPLQDQALANRLLVLYSKAIKDHPTSPKLWLDFLHFLEARCHSSADPVFGTPKDGQISAEKMFESVCQDALLATKFDLRHSNAPWRVYLKHQVGKFERGLIGTESIIQLYLERLCVPHLDIVTTFSDFSTFVTQYDNEHYEQLLAAGNVSYQAAKRIVADREAFESKLIETDQALESFLEYIDWEQKIAPKSPLYAELNLGLLRRALSNHIRSAVLWEKLYFFVLSIAADDHTQMRSILELAIRHCNKDGNLWAHLIRVADKSDACLEQLEVLSNRAIDLVSQDALTLTKIISATFLALRSRITFPRSEKLEPNDLLRYMTQHVHRMKRAHPADEDFLFERLLIQAKTMNDNQYLAAKDWKDLAKKHHAKALFWLRYLEWQLSQGNGPAARNVLKEGCMQTRDAPQVVFEAALGFELRHGLTAEYEKTAAVIRKATQTYLDSMKTYLETPGPAAESEPSLLKRKLSDENVNGSKRMKLEKSESIGQKRDRESTSVIVRDLDPETTSDDLMEFFAQCGTIKAIKIVKLEKLPTSVATIEFDDALDMSTACTKTFKVLRGKQVLVDPAQGTILFVSNWPPSFTVADIEALFAKYGQILETRLPSLTYDQKRRFAYVQMSTKVEALAALSLDGMETEGGLSLSVKLSNPVERQVRKSAISESRELFVKRVSWKATAADIEVLFQPFGKILSIRMPSTISKEHHDGIAFVDFEQSESAHQALELNGKLLNDLTLEVSISEPRSRNRGRTSDIDKQKQTDRNHPPTRSEIEAKTLGIMNLADTVSEVHLRDLFEKFGSIRKIQLRPDHGGAIIEYENQVEAGKAALAMEGHVMADRKWEIGTYQDLMRQGSSQIKKPDTQMPSMMVPRRVRGTTASKFGRKSTNLGAASSGRNVDQTANKVELDASNVGDGASKQDEPKGQDFFRALMDSTA